MRGSSRVALVMRRHATAWIYRAWGWVEQVGTVARDDAVGRRFRSMGGGSYIAFPRGPVFGERWISIGSETLVGAHVSLAVGMPNEAIDPDADPVIVIGNRCMIGRGSSIAGRKLIVVGDGVITGPNIYITDHNHRYSDLDLVIRDQWLVEDPVRIGEGCWLGANVVVLPGADIGRHVVVGAGSVVRGQIPDNCVIAGAPARIVRQHVDGEGWVNLS